MLLYQMYRNVICIVVTISLVKATHSKNTEVCKCSCSIHSSRTLCESVNYMRTEVDANIEELKKWAQLFPFVQNLRNKWREEIISIVETEIKKYIAEGKFVPKPENLIHKHEEEMMNDFSVVSKPSDGGNELAKNVSNLLAKVEMVENRTMEVEEELKSERRVRRHLEQEVKETQSSLVTLEDQLQNVTAPVDARMNHVQMVMFTSLEDMNRTLYEDHLKKLYYKVDGVVYQNETRKLDERIELLENEGRNSSIVSQLSEDVKNLEENFLVLNNSIADDLVLRIMTLETETVKKNEMEDLEHKMANLLNSTEQFRIGLADVSGDMKDFQNFQQNLQNFSQEWSKSLESLQSQIELLKNKTSDHGTANYVVQERDDAKDTDEYPVDGIITINPTETTETEDAGWDYEILSEEVMAIVDNRIRIVGETDDNNNTCEVPAIKDFHLMADVEEDGNGKQGLIFGCRPIGRYVVSDAPIPMRCEAGSWTGPVPSCQELPDETTIELFAQQLKKEHPCTGRAGEYPDPGDCSRFFKCSYGYVTIIPCPHGLHFNPQLKVCDYPMAAGCLPVKSELAQELQDIIPPVIIEPNNLDKPSGLLGTGAAGQLFVHPRSSFTLHCLYPDNTWGSPTWNVTYFNNEIMLKALTTKEGKNRISLTITAATEEDSGLYQCQTPFGKVHVIRVIVKAVLCPPIQLDEEYEDVYYRPTPEGEHRILGTTAEFPCQDGKIFAVCMANGNWSRGPPEKEECTLKRRRASDSWNCLPLDISERPDLILDRNEAQKIVVFKCAGRLRLIGNSFTRCRDDGFWSHTSLPRCVK